ncbi:MAG: hypothetical protein IJK26_09930 [Clostridia bacterium]|nr:hypothetical protein [Clostridia bacterium]
MKLKDVMDFLQKVEDEYGGETEVEINLTDSRDTYAIKERVIPIDRITANSSMDSASYKEDACGITSQKVLLYAELK